MAPRPPCPAAQPIVLRDDFAQTYRPSHHNFTEDFVFDLHLEPGLDPAILPELPPPEHPRRARDRGLQQNPNAVDLGAGMICCENRKAEAMNWRECAGSIQFSRQRGTGWCPAANRTVLLAPGDPGMTNAAFLLEKRATLVA